MTAKKTPKKEQFTKKDLEGFLDDLADCLERNREHALSIYQAVEEIESHPLLAAWSWSKGGDGDQDE